MLVLRSLKSGVLGGRTAVVQIHGSIGGAVKSPDIERLMKQVLDDGRFCALVLDIDSGGGGASASDYIYRAVRRVADQKPVVANIRGIGASGGYMIACAAHAIVAAPGSIVGSIGVISVRPALQQLLEKAGIGVNVNKGGRFKDLGAPWRETTPEEEEKLQQLIDGTYDSFVDIVAERRGLDESIVREIATGEVYLSRRALEVGLVDEVGDLEHALDLASKAAVYPSVQSICTPSAVCGTLSSDPWPTAWSSPFQTRSNAASGRVATGHSPSPADHFDRRKNLSSPVSPSPQYMPRCS